MTIEPLDADIYEPYFEFSVNDVMYFDTDNPTIQDQGIFARQCRDMSGEPIYQNKNTRLADDSTDPVTYNAIANLIVNEGDIRINGVHKPL